MDKLRDIPHIFFVLIAFLATLIIYAFTRETTFLPVVITLGGGLCGLSQKVQPKGGDNSLNTDNIEKAEVTINQPEIQTDEK